MPKPTVLDFGELSNDAAKPEAPSRLRNLREFLRHVVRTATSVEKPSFVSAIPCPRKPRGRRCLGSIAIRHDDDAIEWKCTWCGNQGRLTGFEGCEDDLHVEMVIVEQKRKRRKLLVEPYRFGSWISDDLIPYDRIELRTMYSAVYKDYAITLTASDDEVVGLLDAMAADINHESRPKRRRDVEAIYDELQLLERPKQRPTRSNVEPIDYRSAYAHGFFCAVIAGPMTMPTAWLPRFLSATPPMIEALKTLTHDIMSAHNEVARELLEQRESFGEVTLRVANADATGAALIDWQRGFVEAMAFNQEGWTEFLNQPHLRSLLDPLALVAQCAEDSAKSGSLADAQLRKDVGFALGVMTVRIWENYRHAEPRIVDAEPSEPIRREPKIQRNAPCPCGSGIKYKRCCGATLRPV